jgi:hypothetical protein
MPWKCYASLGSILWSARRYIETTKSRMTFSERFGDVLQLIAFENPIISMLLATQRERETFPEIFEYWFTRRKVVYGQGGGL